MLRFTLTIPTNDNDGNPILSVRYARKFFEGSPIIDGWTSTESFGHWTSPDGKTYAEPVTVLSIDTENDSEVRALLFQLAELIAEVYSQEYVYVTEQPITTYLVPARN